MIYKNHILITSLLILTQIISTSPGHIIIDIDDEKTEQQASLLKEKESLKNYIHQQQSQQWAAYDEITNCCCLTALCLPSIAHILEPFTTITTEEISLLSAFSAGAFILIIDRYAKPDVSREQKRIGEIDDALKEKLD